MKEILREEIEARERMDAEEQARERRECRDTIETECVYPPIPDRSCDWAAYRKGYEPGALVGYGPTKEAAIADLLEQEEER